MNIINKTEVPQKQIGDKLSSSDINKINSAVNQSIDALNQFLKSNCNINQEIGDYDREINLSDAINYVPLLRRTRGLCIKFLSIDTHEYVTYIYQGTNVENSEWNKIENWEELGFNYIDGGIW